MQTVEITIDGMSCGHCVASVRQAIESVEGARPGQVAVGRATVEFDPARANVDQIAEAIRDVGYEPSVVGAESP
jgi:copper chaperone CopZ